MNAEITELLLSEAARINSPEFIAADPVQFPRRFLSSQPDAEIVSLLAAHIAWGNRKMICRDADRMLEMMDGQPHAFVMEGAYEAISDTINIHRTFFGRNLKHFMRGLRAVYSRHATLDDFCRSCGAPDSEFPAWHLAAAINDELARANGGTSDCRCLPLNLQTTALKRLNMALRWLVRNDGIVDLGMWSVLTPAQLFIPLDVHSGNTARAIGLLSRRQNDRRAVLELTEHLRAFKPDDPVIYDFALFGVGVNADKIWPIEEL